MTDKTKKSTTSLKIPETLYEERTLYLYMTDEDFRKRIYNQINVYYTGSENLGLIK